MPRVLPAVLLAALAAGPLLGQNALPPAPRVQSFPAHFTFDPAASAVLRTLWAQSSGEKREYVACLGGDFQGDTVRVRRVLTLEPRAADSLGVSAQQSIDTCGPPDWQGTVHTHIARYDGERPYANFSGADRGVMLMWWKRWKVDGMFCVLYSDRDAYCEVDGTGGLTNMSRSAY